MKRLICLIIFILCLSNNVFANNIENNKEKILREFNIIDSFEDDKENVTRGECIIAIMKAIGVTEETNEMDINRLYNSPIFRDSFTEMDKYKNEYGYIRLAGGKDIARGYYLTHDKVCSGSGMYFLPDKDVTYKEMVLFIMRCLNDFYKEKTITKNGEIIIKEDTDLMIMRAEEIGLINKNDDFYINFDESVSKENFYEIIYRFINQKRYYYGRELNTVTDGRYIDKDVEKSITYLDYLRNREDKNL